MIDKDTKINITAPSFELNDKECILNIQKTLLLSLHENNKISFNQYENAVQLLEKKLRQR